MTQKTMELGKERGQLTIFLGMSMIVIISLIAFVVNVGLFVKARINLQNAVDAAAWAGAATQARQLTQIGYLNWELRNTYKEWMFKYYVLGQMGLSKTTPGHRDFGPDNKMRFRMRTTHQVSQIDSLNVPSICLHFGTDTNICDIYNVPGIPRFDSASVPGVSQRLDDFSDTIAEIKSAACSERSIINNFAATIWTYGTGDEGTFPQAPMVLSHRPGAWPEAIELGFRIRNLEYIVNSPPQVEPLCIRGGDCTGIHQLENTDPRNERTLKAFWSAYRSLSGGAYKNRLDEFSSSFRLTEIPPSAIDVNPNSLSAILIPPGEGLNKHYLDLSANIINYAISFTSFFAQSIGDDGIVDTQEDGACAASKVALPAPGYLHSFTKNSNLMTYYAVMGEAKFKGLFYPFSRSPDGITLRAYAAAKPFGGRIGPRYFAYQGGSAQTGYESIVSRSQAPLRTQGVISGLDLDQFVGVDYTPGFLVPFTQNFWLHQNSDTIGGPPAVSGQSPRFGIPNMIYDFQSGDFNQLSQAVNRQNPLHTITALRTGNMPDIERENAGLHNANQFSLLQQNIGISIQDGSTVDVGTLTEAIYNARRPTRYDALNYMIPIPENYLSDQNESFGVFMRDDQYYQLYAPLMSAGGSLLYDNIDTLVNIAYDIIKQSESAIDSYIASLAQAADAIKTSIDRLPSRAGRVDYGDAYNAIFPLSRAPNARSLSELSNAIDPNNCSLAENYALFFGDFADGGGRCGGDNKTLQQLLREYFNERMTNNDLQNFYITPYTAPSGDVMKYLTAYMPGVRTGASDSAELLAPFTTQGATPRARRNHYSTKFIPIRSVLQESRNSPNLFFGGHPLFSESQSVGNDIMHSKLGGASDSLINTLQDSYLQDFRDPQLGLFK